MRKLRDILRLHFAAALSNRAIARAIGVSASTVSDCLVRARAADVGWPLPESLSDTALDEALYGSRASRQASAQATLPDYAEVHRELRRKGVTLMLLWTEYKSRHPDGLMYSAFSATAPALLYLLHPCSRAIATAPGEAISMSSCARPISPVISCSSIMPGTPCR
jgi:transposase